MEAGEVVAETRKALCDFFGGDEPARLRRATSLILKSKWLLISCPEMV